MQPDRQFQYGDHPRQRLLIWHAARSAPGPATVYFHGGGFSGGTPNGGPWLSELWADGITVVGAGYRLREDRVTKREVLMDGARAVQFIRAHAAELQIDPRRVGTMGDSAGGHLAAWLGYHADVASPGHTDPLRRQSSCAQAVGLIATQPYPLTLADWMRYTGLDRDRLEHGVHAYVEAIRAKSWFEAPFSRSDSGTDAAYEAARRAYDDDVSVFPLAGPASAPTLFLSDASLNPLDYCGEMDLHSPLLMIPLKRKLDEAGVSTFWGVGPDALRFWLGALAGAAGTNVSA